MERNQGLIKSTILITGFSIFGIIISFFTQLLIAYYFGAKFERDAYFVASSISTYLTAIFIGSIGIIFLPRVVDIMKKNSEEASYFISIVFWLLTFFLIFLTIICLIFSNNVVKLIASGFNNSQNIYTSKILIIIIPTVLFNVLANILGSLYQIQHKFLRPALSPILTSVVSLIFVFLFSSRIGIFGLAYGFLTGSLISFIFLLPVLGSFKLRFYFVQISREVFPFIKTFFPLFFTGILFRSTGIFERMIASNLEPGSISFLGYSNQILTILATLTSSGIAVSIYPTLSKLWSENKINEFSLYFVKIIRIILLLTLPISLSILFFGNLFVKIIFERGAFNTDVTIAVTRALSWSMGAFIFQGLGTIIIKIFYISGKTIVLSIIGSIEISFYLILGFILSKHYSFIGLSISLTVSSMINILLSVIFINKYLMKIKFRLLFIDISKILFSSISSILVVYIFYKYIIGIQSTVYLIVSFFFGFSTFLIIGIQLGIEELVYLRGKLLSSKLLN